MKGEEICTSNSGSQMQYKLAFQVAESAMKNFEDNTLVRLALLLLLLLVLLASMLVLLASNK
jgi:hypothetical protein